MTLFVCATSNEGESQVLGPGDSIRVKEDAPRSLLASEELTSEILSQPERKTFFRPITLPVSGKKPRYLQEAEWLGMVTVLCENGFTARLKDYRGGPDMETTFEFDEIPQEDLDLVQVGAEFYWSLGYRTEPNGQRLRYSLVHFRRLPKWSSQKIAAARQKAREMLQEFDSET
jgi:hypothetical protein